VIKSGKQCVKAVAGAIISSEVIRTGGLSNHLRPRLTAGWTVPNMNPGSPARLPSVFAESAPTMIGITISVAQGVRQVSVSAKVAED
jgi:hypothetical protein